jgi:hypothetical protein
MAQSRDMSELNGELWRDLYYASFDDLRLHVRHYPVADSKARPAVCLPGLTRNAREKPPVSIASEANTEVRAFRASKSPSSPKDQ